MTLKELRISKGLSQVECAKYLNMSVRNYQNYESDIKKVNTYKYNDIYNKLVNYNFQRLDKEFITPIVKGSMLNNLYKSVEKYKKRKCFSILKNYVINEVYGKICILYGLRRTGKTTLLFQLINELPINETAYIKVTTNNNMGDLIKDLNALYNQGYRYVLIDEITLLNDFINTAAVLSDVFSMMGMKIIVSGTDSLGFAMANRDELYDRSVMIHTSFISFEEYARLLDINSIDSYIEYGGTLKKENISFNDPEYKLEEVAFRDDESTRKYIDTAISKNIQRTLKNDYFGEYFNELRELYEENELTNVINRIVENMNHRFVLKVVEDKFKSSDFGSARDLLLHDAPKLASTTLYDVDYLSIIDRLKNILDVKEKEETKIKVNNDHINKIKEYLTMLDLIYNIPSRYESGKTEEHYIFIQAGMRYSIAKALVYSLLQDEYFNTLSEADKDYIIKKILEDVKGRMLEDIVLFETKKVLYKKDVFKFKFNMGGEFDMVIYDRVNNTCEIYEIKHSKKIVERQKRYLLDQEKCNIIEQLYGKITDKFILYRGDYIEDNGIKYCNVEDYLIKLYK